MLVGLEQIATGWISLCNLISRCDAAANDVATIRRALIAAGDTSSPAGDTDTNTAPTTGPQ